MPELRLLLPVFVLLGAVVATAQQELVPQGNCRLDTTPVPLGGTTTTTITGTPFVPFLVAADIQPGYRFYPGFGSIYLQGTPSLNVPLDGFTYGFPTFPPSGQAIFNVPLANVPALDGAFVYSQVVALDPGSPNSLAISNAKSFQFGYPDTYHAVIGAMSLARAFHQTAPLPNGAYLVIGGGNGALLLPVASTTCEIYNPYLRTFAAAPPMNVARTLHRATALDDGRILVTGGCQTLGVPTANAEIFDPTTNLWSAPIPMNASRMAHTATKLNDGRVLITGGATSFVLTPPTSTNYLPIFQASIDSAEIFDPTTNTFTPVATPMSAKRFGHAAVVLQSGQVLISGGIRGGQTTLGTGSPLYAPTSDLFDPTTNAFTQVGGHLTNRAVHTLSLLPNGNVLAVGGAGGVLVVSLGSCEIFNPATNTWTSAAPLPSSQLLGLHTALTLPSGHVYVAGGAVGAVGAFQGVTVAYTYDPTTGAWTARASLPAARQAHTATWTPEGVLLIGGADQGAPTATPPVTAQAILTAILWTPN